MWTLYTALGFISIIIVWVIIDISQKHHAIKRNFPIIGHFRYWLESIGPEVRQYIVTSNEEERPFSRDQRRWVYASSKHENNYFGFGTENDLEQESNTFIIKHSSFPLPEPAEGDSDFDPNYNMPCAKIMGKARGRAKAFRPNSVINVSAMSFGSLSPNAIEAINRGVKKIGALHNTGEGGLSPYHKNGGDLTYQIGTSYFGCRDLDGKFNIEKLQQIVENNPIKSIEIKLSQGAKPAKGGILPAAKITKEIAAIRNIPMGKDCISPSSHKEFHDVDSLLDFVEKIADATGLPVGIKSAIGDLSFWHDLAKQMKSGKRGVDFITVDGGEGGTGAAPLVFTNHVSLPFKLGMSEVYKIFAEKGLTENIIFIGSGRLGFPEMSLVAFALGCDMINVARETMLALGCVQAQRCHTGFCPTGVATQNRWFARGLNAMLKSDRVANYIKVLRKEILQLSHACGVPHPSLIPGSQLVYLAENNFKYISVKNMFGYDEKWGYPSSEDKKLIKDIMTNGKKAQLNA